MRREEVATLADVSVDYLVRLEQGRDVNPSPSVQTALARALRLSVEERMHLGMLAARTNHPEACPTAPPFRQEVAPTVRLLLGTIDAAAFVIGPGTDILAWNRPGSDWSPRSACSTTPPPTSPATCSRIPAPRATFPDWSSAADEQANRLRAAELRWGEDPAFVALVDELLAIPEFAARWPAHDVAQRHRANNRLLHPDLGDLSIVYEVLDLPDDGGQRLVAWLPADNATAAALRTARAGAVTTGPPQLRVVGEP